MTSCPQADGTTYTTADGQQYVLYCDQAYKGSDLPAQYATTWEQCMEFCDNYVRTQAEQNGASCIAAVWTYNNPHGANCYPKYALGEQIVEQSGTNSARRVQYQVFQPPMYVDFSKSQAPAIQTPLSTQQPAPPPASTPGVPVQQPASTQVPATVPAQPTTNAVPPVLPASTKNAQSTPATRPQSKTGSNSGTSTAISALTSSLSSDHSFTSIPTNTILGTHNQTQIAVPDTTIAVSTLPGGATLYSTIIHDTTIVPASPTDLSSPLQTPPTGLSTDAKIGLAVGITIGTILLLLLALLAIMRIRKSRRRKAKGARLNEEGEEPEEKIVMGYQAQRSEMWATYNGIPGIHELYGGDAPELEGKRMEAAPSDIKIQLPSLPRPPSGTHPSKWASFGGASRPQSRPPELDGRNVPGTPRTPNALVNEEGRPMSDALLGQRWLRGKWKFGGVGGSFGKSSLRESFVAGGASR